MIGLEDDDWALAMAFHYRAVCACDTYPVYTISFCPQHCFSDDISRESRSVRLFTCTWAGRSGYRMNPTRSYVHPLVTLLIIWFMLQWQSCKIGRIDYLQYYVHHDAR
jgi:hypothetical protein